MRRLGNWAITTNNEVQSMKRSLIYFAMLIAFCRCATVQFEKISEEMKPNLQSNDTIYFVNHCDHSLTDTFVIDIKNEHTMLFDRTRIYERVYLKYHCKNNNQFRDIEVELLAPKRLVISDYIYSNNKEMVDIEVDCIRYDVFALKNVSPETNTLPDSLYYSYKEGIMRYYYSDTIYNKIKNV